MLIKVDAVTPARYWIPPDVAAKRSTLANIQSKGNLAGFRGWLEYDFNVATPGWYSLDGSILDGPKGIGYAGKEYIFSIDGVKIEKGNWHKVGPRPVYLTTGKHTLRFENRNSFPAMLAVDAWVFTKATELLRKVYVEMVSYHFVRLSDRVHFRFHAGHGLTGTIEVLVRDAANKTVAKYEATLAGDVTDLRFPLPAEGLYTLVLRDKAKIRQATVTIPDVVAVNTSAGLEVGDNDVTLVTTIDPTATPPLYGNHTPQVMNSKLGNYLELGGFGWRSNRAVRRTQDVVTTSSKGHLNERYLYTAVQDGTEGLDVGHKFTIRFKSSTAFTLAVTRDAGGAVGALAGQTGNTSTNFAPTMGGKPLFTLTPKAWKGSWKTGDTVEIYFKRAHWVAWPLTLEVEQEYLIEVDVPEDKVRAMGVSLVQHGFNLMSGGTECGWQSRIRNGVYTFSRVELSRAVESRLAIFGVMDGEPAAVQAIRVYRINQFRKPSLPVSERVFAISWEEGENWEQVLRGLESGSIEAQHFVAANRFLRRVASCGANAVMVPIQSYNHLYIPSRWAPHRDKQTPYPSILAIMLFAEKYGLKVILELTPNNGDLSYITGKPKSDYLVTRSDGKVDRNVLDISDPEVVQWFANILSDVNAWAKQWPAFHSLAIRFMRWRFHGVIGWRNEKHGYGPKTLARYKAATGSAINVRLNGAAAYAWLMAKEPEQWRQWRKDVTADIWAKYASAVAGTEVLLCEHYFGKNPFTDSVDWAAVQQIPGIRYCKVPRYGRKQETQGAGTREWFNLDRTADLRDPAKHLVQAAPGHSDMGFVQEYLESARYSGGRLSAETLQSASMGLVPPGSGPNSSVNLSLQMVELGDLFAAKYRIGMSHGVQSLIFDMGNSNTWQPPELRAFLADYYALPPGNWQRVPCKEPVSAWTCESAGYLANNAPYPVRAWVNGQQVDLGAYGLHRVGSALSSVTVQFPPAELSRLRAKLRELMALRPGLGRKTQAAMAAQLPAAHVALTYGHLLTAEMALYDPGIINAIVRNGHTLDWFGQNAEPAVYSNAADARARVTAEAASGDLQGQVDELALQAKEKDASA